MRDRRNTWRFVEIQPESFGHSLYPVLWLLFTQLEKSNERLHANFRNNKSRNSVVMGPFLPTK